MVYPVVLELNRMHNLLTEKSRELGIAQGEIKALRACEVLKDKAVEENWTRNTGSLKVFWSIRYFVMLMSKTKYEKVQNLEIKKLTDDKRDALAAQYAAEATVRRVHANRKDDESPSIESVVAPLEAEIKMHKNEIAALQEDNKALQRLTKSKESALLEAERILRSALERALIVEEEENRILEKTNRQKVLEVEKLSQTIQELEEAILAGGAAANAIRDYKRQIEELHEEKRSLERELARVKVSANRVATVIANEWKDENDKVMPVKQWLEERRLMQADMQRLREKLAISDRTAKAEAQLKEKLKLRLKTLEEGLKHVSSYNPHLCVSPKAEKSSNFLGFLKSNGGLGKRSTSQPRASTIARSSPVQQPNSDNEAGNAAGQLKRSNSLRKKYGSGELMLKKSLWASRSKVVDIGEKENTEMKATNDTNKNDDRMVATEIEAQAGGNEDSPNKISTSCDNEDMVSGFLYDRLQKEVLNLRKHCEAKESDMNAKDQEIKMLMKKVDALSKAMEVESKKMKREAAARDKEAAAAKMDDNKKNRNINSSKRAMKAS
ncbi:microtubule-associated proteins 70-5 [Prunus dulcis]|uniref:Microtubule-associated proteins 70-5 n=1 Tax=Prunus dulcis TaxID=3755 RepID=A0A4Y1R8Y2_PRUDU|nr:microtubule-associated proteins 70-5 [Prunus dulcis]